MGVGSLAGDENLFERATMCGVDMTVRLWPCDKTRKVKYSNSR